MLALAQDISEHLAGFTVTSEETPLVTRPEDIFPHFAAARRLDIPEERFLAWVAEADYEHAGPSWWSQFSTMHLRKMLEHYASIELVGIRAGGTYMDAAASASPFYQVVRRTHGAAMCYRQDLNRAAGVHGDTIGSDASAIPLPDASLDGIVTHNSWEHFEGESAMGFVRESVRLLRPGARLCILPMNFRERTEIWTAPSCWATKYRNAPDYPRFDPRAAIVIKEETVQRQVMWWNPAELAAELAGIAGMDFEIVQVVCAGKAMYALVGIRTGQAGGSGRGGLT
jgi:SAM-dependent methyltransferase